MIYRHRLVGLSVLQNFENISSWYILLQYFHDVNRYIWLYTPISSSIKIKQKANIWDMVRNAPSIMCLDVLLFWIVLHQRWPFSNLEMVMEKYCNICCSLYFGLYTIILTICALFPRLYLSIKMHYKLFVV